MAFLLIMVDEAENKKRAFNTNALTSTNRTLVLRLFATLFVKQLSSKLIRDQYIGIPSS